jgi:hypothetical protein
MEARHYRAAMTAALLVALMGANYRTTNFVVETADPALAEQFAKAAEKYRKELAVEWIGQEMPNWSQPGSITVKVGPNLGAGGATSFLFEHGEVYGWKMDIQGSAERVLDSVLPHEITHMILASHFRCPLPRWADEGAATNTECPSEKAKHRQMLLQFLRTNRGIAFNQMYAMRDYPHDIMPLYAQSHALADYLIQQRGRRAFVAYVEDGMRSGRWGEATERHYGIQDLGALQNQWVAWVGQGFPTLTPKKETPEATKSTMIASNADRLPRPEPNLVLRVNTKVESDSAATEIRFTRPQPAQTSRQTALK